MLLRQIPLTFFGSGIASIYELTQGDDGESRTKDITLIVIGTFGAICLLGLGFFISKRAKATAKKLRMEEEGKEKELLLQHFSDDEEIEFDSTLNP